MLLKLYILFGGRSTAIRLSTGEVWVLASTPLTPDTKSAIDNLGPVKYVFFNRWIMAADAVHHLFLGQFRNAYPDAKLIGVEALIEKKKKEGLIFDGAYGKDAPNTQYGFEDEIYAWCVSRYAFLNFLTVYPFNYFSGFRNKDVAWFHAASETLIVADLMFNLPGNEQYSRSKSSPKLPILGSLGPWGSTHKYFVWGLGKDKAAMTRDAKTVLGWAPKRIIMCHGDVIETEGTKAWATAYSKYLS
ncbi:hypothetical protein K438DRAFT_1577501 [Mycena galopus ATCC 62051]|nr:hypothetical protein K438DRAFT_1577501 [Mycena galopus ATCC 62051]